MEGKENFTKEEKDFLEWVLNNGCQLNKVTIGHFEEEGGRGLKAIDNIFVSCI